MKCSLIILTILITLDGCNTVRPLRPLCETDFVKSDRCIDYLEGPFIYEGLVDCNTGRYQNHPSSFVSTDYIDVAEYKYIEYSLPYSNSSGITFYNEQKQRIAGVNSEIGQHVFMEIPVGTRYVRLSQRTNDGMEYSFSLHKKNLRNKVKQLETNYEVVFSPNEFVYNDIDKSGLGFLNPSIKGDRKAVVRIPVHIITNTGTKLVACQVFFEKDGRKYSWVYIARSLKNEKGWKKQALYRGSNPNLIYDRINGNIFAMTDIAYYISKDDGETWSKAIPLGLEKPEGWTEFYQSPVNGIQLENGVLATVYELVRLNKGKVLANVNTIVYSRDFGKTWEISPHTPVEIIANEAALAEFSPNQIMINARGGTEVSLGSENPGRRVFVQNTKGESKRAKWKIEGWSVHESDKKLIEPVCNASFITINNNGKRIGLFCNPHVSSNPRRNLMLQCTSDFKRWQEVGLLSPRDSTVYGYCSIAGSSGKLFFVYESIERGILYTDITACQDDINQLLNKK